MSFEENQNNDVFVVDGVANYSFVKESVKKVSIMWGLLSFFYYIGWSYKQWKGIKKYNESYKNISPFWRGILFIVFFSKLKKIIIASYESKMNIVLQNENIPEEEKKQWENEYNALKRSSAKLKVIQSAVNKIVPFGHPQGKLFTVGDFLGILLIVFMYLIICVFSILTDYDNCFEPKGDTGLINTCKNYSLTYPLKGHVFPFNYDKYSLYCQEDENEMICASEGKFDNPEDFNLETLAKRYSPINKFTKKYAGNTTHCIVYQEKDGSNFQTCFMKIEREEPSYLIFFRNAEKSYSNIGNFEKLMNSYKNL